MYWMLLPLRRFARFSGRSRPLEYWMFFLFNILVGLFVGLAFGIAYYAGMTQTQMDTYLLPVVLLAGLYSVVAFIPGLAVTIRRLHDTDRSGWNILWGLVPLAGPIILQVFYVSPGTKGANRFGPDPLGEGATFA